MIVPVIKAFNRHLRVRIIAAPFAQLAETECETAHAGIIFRLPDGPTTIFLSCLVRQLRYWKRKEKQMSFKRMTAKAVLICGLLGTTVGVLPAPMCPDCRTPGNFSTYMTNLNAQPGILTQLWSYLTGLF
jgi:hypothetical protein